MTKDKVLQLLREHEDSYISGAELGRCLSLSRTAVWKAIVQLKAEGYLIESITKRGYRLSSRGDVLNAESVRKYLRHTELTPEIYRTITSTNTVLKARAAEGAPEGLVLIAGEQTAGRGRLGRSFYSPDSSGLYMSLLLRPKIPAQEATRITASAAVAVAETIEELSGNPTRIKWVNDVMMEGKKVCGILTEASFDCESGQLAYVIVGIGINVAVPAGGFPEELGQIAGAAFDGVSVPELRAKLAAGVLDRLMDLAVDLSDPACFEAYHARSLVLGRAVNLLVPGRDPEPAEVLALNRDYSLRVRMPDGSERNVSSGEVSIRLTP
ncbi:MAG: biotin--[Oscillospiraceae bacterium]|nr:biotin--[acetyl-CoA-carboxylase] ligase [Oscillospiraceae bacterium]